MNAKSFLSLLSIAVILGACKKDLEPQEASATPTAATSPTATTDAAVAQMTPTTAPNMAAPGQATAQPAQPAPTAPGMNPAHGQPGHRCDIAVGAPLNSPAKMTSQPAMTINPQTGGNQSVKMTPTQNTPAMLQPPAGGATATAPGMNPAHGQPGHRCDIAVGAPLNSAPTNNVKVEPTSPQITVSDPKADAK